MKLSYSILAVALISGFSAAPASAATHYVSGNVGISWMNDINDGGYYSDTYSGSNLNMKTGLTALGAVGCDYGKYRMEGELGYQTAGADNRGYENYRGDVTIVSLLANGYYDMGGKGVQPYLTAGAGLAQINGDKITAAGSEYSTNSHDITLAYQVGAGIAIPISKNVKLDARYRYFATTEFGGNDNINVSSHNALLGLRFDL